MRRARRIGLTEADRLVAGARPDPGMEGLVGLLDAARTPSPQADLAGERAAVAGFLDARQRAVPSAPPRRRNLVVRTIAMKVALVFAVLAFGGTAVAARTGSLPHAVQERAHSIFSDVGVPAPEPARSEQITTDGVTASAVPSQTPSPARSATPRPSETAMLALCRAWDTARRDPPGKAVPAKVRRSLAAAAGGVPKIDEFCAAQLGKASESPRPPDPGKPAGPGKPPGTGTASTSAPTPAPPSQPGKGIGKGNDKSHGPGN